MKLYLIVFAGAGIGGSLRHGVNQLALHLFGAAFPYGTLAVNLIGSFVMGLLTGYFAFRGDLAQEYRLLLTTGVLGGFTTFSAFSLDVALLWERGTRSASAGYVVVSVAGAIAALFLGLWIARSFDS